MNLKKLTLQGIAGDMNTAESEGLARTSDSAIDGAGRLIVRADYETSYVVRLELVKRTREWWRKHGRLAE